MGTRIFQQTSTQKVVVKLSLLACLLASVVIIVYLTFFPMAMLAIVL